jgi:dTDP-4-amino-4,6-dideoxygalactose transaminase
MKEQRRINRRKFISAASIGAASAIFPKKDRLSGMIFQQENKLAVLGGEPLRNKPFTSWPQSTGKIEELLIETAKSGKWCRLDGGAKYVSAFEKEFARLLGSRFCLATGSGTQSLHTALYAVGVEAGDEVLVSPLTYIASPQAIFLCNALPVFVDVDIDTFQIDPGKMEPLINENTKAVEPVHIAGLPAQMDQIMGIARKHNLRVVEDACQAALAQLNHKSAGTYGDLGCYSFQSSKVIPCGEGGAIVGDDENLIDVCYAFHNIGLPRRDKVSSVKDSIMGPKYRMNEWEGAVLMAQIDTFEEQVNLRNENAAYLSKRLDEIPGITPQRLSKGVTRGTYYLYGFRYQKELFNEVPKSKFLKALRAEGIPNTAMYFDRLNTQNFVEHTLNSKAFRIIYSKNRLQRYREQNQCPVNDKLSEQGVWLTQQMLLGTRKDMDDIADAILKIQKNKDDLAKS